MQEDLIAFPQVEEKWAYELSLTRKPIAQFKAVKTSTAEAAADYLFALGVAENPEENFIVLALNMKNVIVGHTIISKGLIDRTCVHAREVFRPAILHNAAKIIVAHNHPSGDVTPSNADIRTTETLREVGQLIGIDIVDHIIVGYDLLLQRRIFKSLRKEGHFNNIAQVA